MNCEYVAQVVRVDKLPNGKFGVAVNLLMTVNYSASTPGIGARALIRAPEAASRIRYQTAVDSRTRIFFIFTIAMISRAHRHHHHHGHTPRR